VNRPRRLAAEAIGSALLAAAVVGSGVMAERLAGGNAAVALLANTGATVAVLATLIALFGPISGADFNPAVSLIQAIRNTLSWRDAVAYTVVQVLGCCMGVMLAHAMFDLPWLQSSLHNRSGASQCLSEGVATFGLLLVILGHRRPEDAPCMVAGWIGAAYWFTASTSFANPAITIARSLSDTFAGIRPVDVPGFIAAQFIGALTGLLVARFVFTADPVEAGCRAGRAAARRSRGKAMASAAAISRRTHLRVLVEYPARRRPPLAPPCAWQLLARLRRLGLRLFAAGAALGLLLRRGMHRGW
jgi:glycerol uptake facilitator-like aquaporin